MGKEINLKEAVKFHGHLGPYLILGLKAGELALKKLKAKKYFGIYAKVYGASAKPKSCLIDGLQLATGATYGKGNIRKLNSKQIKIDFYNRIKQSKITLMFKDGIREQLEKAKTHSASEILARKLYRADYSRLFQIIPTTYDL